MKNKKVTKWLTLAFSGVLVVSSTGCDLFEAVEGVDGPVGNMMVKTALTTQKVTLEEDISALSDAGMYISGAKGEADSAQFIVKCDENVSSYDVVISDFKNGDEVISKENVEICKQIYTLCTTSSGFMGTLPMGYYPDALIPLEYIKAEGEDVITKGKNQGFWLNVDIPDDAEAGTYTATVTMTYNKTGSVEVPVTLEVYDFELGLTDFKSCFMIWQGWLSYGELTSSNEKYMDYYDKLLDYNMFAYTFPADTPEMFVSYVREYYDKIASFGMPYRAISNTQNDWPWARERMVALLDACIEDGINYFDKAYYYWDMYYDEYTMVPWRYPLVRPTLEGCNDMEAEIINQYVAAGKITADGEIAQSISGLRHAITAGWDEEFSDLFGLCTPGHPLLAYTEQQEFAQELREEKDVEWWSYGCVGTDKYPNPGWEINDYMVTQREFLWNSYANDIMGTLYWCVNAYCNVSYYTTWGYSKILDFYTIASHEGVTNGDGYLFYPGAPYGSDSPFASIRMAAYRDGVDDHTYMTQLTSLYEALSEKYGVDAMDSKNFVSFLNEQLLGRNASKLNYEGTLNAKDVLASAIVMAEKNGLVIDNLVVEGNEIVYSFYANDGVTLTLNGAELSSTVSGNGKHFAGRITIPANRSLVLSIDGEGGADTITLATVPQVTEITGFETAEEVEANAEAFYMFDSVSLNTNSAYAKSGNSMKVELYGRTGSETIIKSYAPRFAMDMTAWGCRLADIWSIEFEVYNASDKDVTYVVYLEGESKGVTITTDYDQFVLRAGEWRKVKIDNLKLISMKDSVLGIYTWVGLKSLSNFVNDNSLPYSMTLYVDNLVIRKN